MLAYLGYCGPARDACQNIDAATLKYFKIMQKARISDDLRMSLSPQLDGNVLNVTIPSSVRTGSYIMRCVPACLPPAALLIDTQLRADRVRRGNVHWLPCAPGVR
jgi:hypothetical protein